MINYFSKYKFIFYLCNLILIFLYLFPGSVLGWFLYKDLSLQPQITPDFVVSSNHLYAFIFLAVISFLSYDKSSQIKIVKIYLIVLSIILELFHLIIPDRSFQWHDLFGYLLGVIIVILIQNLINKYGFFKK